MAKKDKNVTALNKIDIFLPLFGNDGVSTSNAYLKALDTHGDTQ